MEVSLVLMVYTNKDTGNLYTLLREAVDCTNGRHGTPVAIYSPIADLSKIYVQDLSEFVLLFEWAKDSPYQERCCICVPLD